MNETFKILWWNYFFHSKNSVSEMKMFSYWKFPHLSVSIDVFSIAFPRLVLRFFIEVVLTLWCILENVHVKNRWCPFGPYRKELNCKQMRLSHHLIKCTDVREQHMSMKTISYEMQRQLKTILFPGEHVFGIYFLDF